MRCSISSSRRPRLRDLTALRNVSNVVFEPREQGTVLSFEIKSVEEVSAGSKVVRVDAQVRRPDGQTARETAARHDLGADDHRSGGGRFNSTFVICHRRSRFSRRTAAVLAIDSRLPAPRIRCRHLHRHVRPSLALGIDEHLGVDEPDVDAAGGRFPGVHSTAGLRRGTRSRRLRRGPERCQPDGGRAARAARSCATSLSSAGTDNAAATSPICRLSAREGLNHHW